MMLLGLSLLLLPACKDDGEVVDSEESAPPAVDADGDGFSSDEDCNDDDPAVNPDAEEVCDGFDNDCDFFVDDADDDLVGGDTVSYLDEDQDGYGDAEQSVTSCSVPLGYSADSSDCDDSDPRVHPGAAEVCGDGVDGDCEGGDVDCVTELAAADARLFGVAPFDRTGVLTTSLRDVNEDGRDDFAVSASVEQTNDGLVYVYLEPPSGEQSVGDAPFVLRGGAGVGAGRALTGGDFNGDGVGDLVVSGFRDSTLASRAGAVYFFFGPIESGERVIFEFDISMLGVNAEERMGSAVASLGDVDGDGSDDLMYGAYLHDWNALSDVGAVYFNRGPFDQPQSPTGAAFVVHGEAEGDQLGSRAAAAGDMDADGFVDFMVASRLHDAGGADAGAVWIESGNLGGEVLSSDLSQKLVGDGEGAQLGSAVVSLGDLDEDGYDDILVGALGAGDGGEAYVVLGPGVAEADVSSAAHTVFVAVGSGDQLGATVDAAKDRGMAVGANRAGDDDAGAVYVFRGLPAEGRVDVSDADLSYLGEGAGDYLGSSVAFTEGEGERTSIVLGASGSDATAEDAGAAFLFGDAGL